MEDCIKYSDLEDEDASRSLNDSTSGKYECAVCLQTCIQPVQLPCSHIFCYLCVKGVTHQSKRCAMCRQEIPPNFLDNPHLIQVKQTDKGFEDGHQWYYEGRNGWWQYDERTSAEIESAFKKGSQECEVLIAGFLYVIDFQNLVQMRRSDLFRKRRIKRDLCSIPKKGVAGIRAQNIPMDTSPCKEKDSSSEDVAHSNDSSTQDQNRICGSSDAGTSSSEPLDLSKLDDNNGVAGSRPDTDKNLGKVKKCAKCETDECTPVSPELNEVEKITSPRTSRRRKRK